MKAEHNKKNKEKPRESTEWEAMRRVGVAPMGALRQLCGRAAQQIKNLDARQNVFPLKYEKLRNKFALAQSI